MQTLGTSCNTTTAPFELHGSVLMLSGPKTLGAPPPMQHSQEACLLSHMTPARILHNPPQSPASVARSSLACRAPKPVQPRFPGALAPGSPLRSPRRAAPPPGSSMAPGRPSNLSSRAHSVFQGSSGCTANGASCSSGFTTTLLASLELGPSTACADLCTMPSMLHAMQRMKASRHPQPRPLRSSARDFFNQEHITLA